MTKTIGKLMRGMTYQLDMQHNSQVASANLT